MQSPPPRPDFTRNKRKRRKQIIFDLLRQTVGNGMTKILFNHRFHPILALSVL